MTPRSAAEREPGTAAGQALSKAWRVRRTASPGLEEAWPEQFDRYVLAIEAEATAAVPLDVERLAKAIAGGGYEAHPADILIWANEIATEYFRLGLPPPANASADEEEAPIVVHEGPARVVQP